MESSTNKAVADLIKRSLGDSELNRRAVAYADTIANKTLDPYLWQKAYEFQVDQPIAEWRPEWQAIRRMVGSRS